jgi:uncharacterized protein YjbJ (UPF0337 family)
MRLGRDLLPRLKAPRKASQATDQKGDFTIMNKDTIEGNWKQLKGKVQARWGKLTDDDLTVAAGNTEILRGRIQERYGIAKEEAQKQLDEFVKQARHEEERQSTGANPR